MLDRPGGSLGVREYATSQTPHSTDTLQNIRLGSDGANPLSRES